MNRKVKQIVLPLLAAFIWGSAFVAQKGGAEMLGALSFNWTRSLVAALGLSVLVWVMDRRADRPKKSGAEQKRDRRELLRGGLVVGTILAVGSTLQQYGIAMTTAGKAGFLTALYIVLVPLFGMLFGSRVRPSVWLGVAAALAGLYFLSFAAGGEASFGRGDLLVIACAFVFASHILAVDHFTKTVDGIKLSCLQFLVAGAELLIAALFVEGLPLRAILDCMPFILYAGVLSGGVGYTLQILAQKDGEPAVVSLLLSLEAFFAAVSGALVLHERLSAREYIGCALMLCAVVLVQLPEKKTEKPAKLS
ncbi:MAG: DMT family transporter [Oscillospiraceae bacterium]|nr:DMT family transporter [Oscillospiraceae bacterium]